MTGGSAPARAAMIVEPGLERHASFAAVQPGRVYASVAAKQKTVERSMRVRTLLHS